jgi:RND family efflux transporter MFP subunit
LVVWTGIAACGCQQQAPAAPKGAPPAKVAAVAKEDQLNTIVLTPEAEQRLGIATASVEVRKLPRLRTYGCEAMLPTGASIVVSAPLSGTLQAAGKAGVPQAGATIRRGQPIFSLLPLLSPERSVLTPAERIRFAEARNAVATSRIDAEGQVEQAQVQVEAAKIALERAERLLREQAGTVRAVDEAKAQQSLAQKGLDAALARKKLVDNIKLDEEAGTLEPLVIESPHAGILRASQVAPGEVVAAGAPLFEVMNTNPMWIKVPVYAGELAEIDAGQPARVSTLAGKPSERTVSAKPIAAPPTAAPLSSSVDLYYELENPTGQFRPGEKLAATLVLTGDHESRAVPWSAVVQDINGGNWVYVKTAEHTFARRRLQVRHVIDGWAVLENGPNPGELVVTDGAAELFGAEFGFGK